MRRETWKGIALVLGGQAEADYRTVFAKLDAVAQQPCTWHALSEGELMGREAMRSLGAKAGSRLAGEQAKL